MIPALPPIPGYTATEKRLLQAMVDELCTFTAQTGWEQRLPFAVHRAYVMERLGNLVQFGMKLYWRTSSNGQAEVILLFDSKLQGTVREKWATATGGFFLHHGTALRVAAVIASYQTDISPIQEQLAQDYRATFYNS